MMEIMGAMKQALEALEQLQGGCTDSDDGTVEAITVWCPEVIDALRQAIEQAEQQEPVAWCDMAYANLGAVRDKMPLEQVTAVQDWLEKVYTTPPQRKHWVGLTAEEIWQCNTAPAGHHVECHICVAHQNVLDFAEAIEAKLKEKNKW